MFPSIYNLKYKTVYTINNVDKKQPFHNTRALPRLVLIAGLSRLLILTIAIGWRLLVGVHHLLLLLRWCRHDHLRAVLYNNCLLARIRVDHHHRLRIPHDRPGDLDGGANHDEAEEREHHRSDSASKTGSQMISRPVEVICANRNEDDPHEELTAESTE